MKTSAPEREPDYIPKTYQKSVNSCPKLPILTHSYSMNDSPNQSENSEPKPRSEEARRRRRERRNKDFKGLKLFPVMLRKKQFWRVTKPQVGGGRTVRSYANRDEAETAFDIAYTQAKNHGIGSFALNDVQLVEAREAYRLLEPFSNRYTLISAVQFFADHMRRIETSATVKTAIDEMYKAKKQDALSKAYLFDLRQRLSRFERIFGSRPIASVSSQEIETWLRELGLSPASRNSYHQRLSTLWTFASGRNWVESNLLTKVARAKVVGTDIGILTPDQFALLLANAIPETLPFWAIGGFTGMRVAELKRLDRSRVDFDTGLIEVTARMSKTASRRHVEIVPALKAWLEPYKGRTGMVCTVNWRKLIDADKKRAGIAKWPINGCRHSFASYWLAHFKDASRLALLMGHAKTDLLFRHYRALVKPTEAAKWWSIYPNTKSNLVEFAAA
jgi:integrase